MVYKVYKFNGEKVQITHQLRCRRIRCGWTSVLYTDVLEDGDLVQIERTPRTNIFIARRLPCGVDDAAWLIPVRGFSVSSTDPTTNIVFGGIGSDTHLVSVRAGHMLMAEDEQGNVVYYIAKERHVDEVDVGVLDLYDALCPGRPQPHWARVYDVRVDDTTE